MKNCEYGCGREAMYFKQPSRKVPNGRWMCTKHHLQCPMVQTRRADAVEQKYGTRNIFQIYVTDPKYKESKAKRDRAAADRMKDKTLGLGFNNQKNLDRANAAFWEKYGVDNAMYLESAKQNLIQTNMDRYGVPCKVAAYNHYQKSKIADRWLDEIGVPNNYREQWIKVSGRNYKADAYDPTTNTVYEFYGNYWHGNPRMFEPDVVNKQAHRTMRELFERTVAREQAFRDAGYTIVSIWEDEYKNGGT